MINILFRNFFVPAKKLHKKPRKLYLRSLINCNVRPKRLNSLRSNSSRFVAVSLTLIIRFDRLANSVFIDTTNALKEHCVGG